MTQKSPMDAATIKAQVQQNADQAGLVGARIHVARTEFGGFRVRVVHDSLTALPEAERQSLLLSGIRDHIDHHELVTSDEEEWYGPPFLEVEEDLPSWPEVLEKPPVNTPLLFASDLDQEVSPPVVTTFYSLRGGVGRTTALAAAARLLAARGRRVLCIDMDFEAPGLPYLLGLEEPETDHGAVPLLLELEQGEDADIRDHIQRVTEGDELYCLPAGRLGVDYAQRLRLLDPEIWYRETPNPLHRLLELAGTSSINPDVVLLDARTGISPISAPLLFDISDLAVICFFPHPQTRRGTELLVRSLLNARTRRSNDLQISPEPRFLVSPVPPGPSAERLRDRATQWIDEWLSHAQERRSSEVGQLQGDELTYPISYSAETAFTDRLGNPNVLTSVYGPVADWIEQLLPQAESLPQGPSIDKRSVLEELDFAAGTAEHQANFFEDFVKTSVSLEAMDSRYPLVVGRKGTGKTAVFRWLLERPEPGHEPIAVMCPNAFRNQVTWALGADGFAIVEDRFKENMRWQTFWSCYTALAAYFSLLSLPGPNQISPPSDLGLSDLPTPENLDDLAMVNMISTMLTRPEAGLLATRWLREIDQRIDSKRLLLFDGLDTGFGNDNSSRERRTRAVAGLFTFLTETESRLHNLAFKVLLRFDIWQASRFENKSHLHGRLIQLRWHDQAEYFKTALKQAVRSPFTRMLEQVKIDATVDQWSANEVFRAWNLLVGERMKGGKTAFTRNWVWNRLADGRGDRGPRSLSQLFSEAVSWERREESRNPYDRSILRPRALVPSLTAVSEQAKQAISEEFPELDRMITALETVGRTPLDISDIHGVLDQLDLALEVGLLAEHEITPEGRRFRVPDLYRHALGMTRKGQA